MFLICSFSFCAWSCHPADMGSRHGVDFNLILTAVAFKLVLTSMLPPVSYVTLPHMSNDQEDALIKADKLSYHVAAIVWCTFNFCSFMYYLYRRRVEFSCMLKSAEQQQAEFSYDHREVVDA